MFQLESALKDWRTRMVQHGTVASADVDELESHLRDDMEQLVEQGLSEAEAFLVAAHRLGTPSELAAEYGKVNTALVWTRRVFWMLTGFMAVSLLLAVVSTAGQWVSTGAMLTGLAESPAMRVGLQFGFLAVLIVSLVALLARGDGRRILVEAADRLWIVARRHPVTLLVGALLLYFAVRAAGIGRQIVLVQMFQPEIIGQEAYYNACYRLAVSVIVPLLIFALMAWIWRSLHGRRV